MKQPALPFGAPPRSPRGVPLRDTLLVGRRPLVVTFVRHRRARHYLLRVEADGSVRVTVPRGGSEEEAARFVREKIAWIERERYRVSLRRAVESWQDGTLVMLGGERVPIAIAEADAGRMLRFGGESIALPPSGTVDLKRLVERRLRELASARLPVRLGELAAVHGYSVSRVTVRDQQTRWGSCSPSGRISLNWRLVQMPDSVRDYVLLHELTHLRHMNHSKRFWRELERVCPWHHEARAWLKAMTGRTRAGESG